MTTVFAREAKDYHSSCHFLLGDPRPWHDSKRSHIFQKYAFWLFFVSVSCLVLLCLDAQQHRGIALQCQLWVVCVIGTLFSRTPKEKPDPIQVSSNLVLFIPISQYFKRYGHRSSGTDFIEQHAIATNVTADLCVRLRSGSSPDRASCSWLRGKATNCHRYFLNHELQCNGTGVAKVILTHVELVLMYSGTCPHMYFTRQ